MIDFMLSEKKAVVGLGGYMERMKVARVTRGLRMMWNKNCRLDYDGTLSEWELWRKAAIDGTGAGFIGNSDATDVANGAECSEALDSSTLAIYGGQEQELPQEIIEAWEQADLTVSSGSHWCRPAQISNLPMDTFDITAGGYSSRPNSQGHESFESIPPHLQAEPRYQWRDPTLSPRPAVSIAIPAKRPESTLAPHTTTIQKGVLDEYGRPLTVTDYIPAFQKTGRGAKKSTNPATAHTLPSKPQTSFTDSAYDENGHSPHGDGMDESEVAGFRSRNFQDPEEGQVILGVVGRQQQYGDGKVVHKEKLPFNRFEGARGANESSGDIGMGDG
jgi:hypothetical protein